MSSSNYFQAPTSSSLDSEAIVGPFSIFKEGAEMKNSLMRFSEWSVIEKGKYAAFIDFNSKSMEGKEHKNLWKKYELMGEYIQTRNYRQCKSYHQKMVEKHKNFQNILQFLFEESPEVEEIARKEKEQMIVLSSRQSKKGLQKQLPVLSSTSQVEQKGQGIKVEKSKEDEWKQCHALFLKWTNRLQNLIIPEHKMIA